MGIADLGFALMSQSTHSVPPNGTAAARSSFAEGVRDIAPLMVVDRPFGIVYGALAAQSGLSLTENVLLSELTYAGASQFVAVEFWADPLPPSGRFFSRSSPSPSATCCTVPRSADGWRSWSPVTRYVGFAFLTDPTFALAELHGGPRLTPAYYFGFLAAALCELGHLDGDRRTVRRHDRRPEDVRPRLRRHRLFPVPRRWFSEPPERRAGHPCQRGASLAAYLAVGSPWHIGAGAVAGMILAAALAGGRAPA